MITIHVAHTDPMLRWAEIRKTYPLCLFKFEWYILVEVSSLILTGCNHSDRSFLSYCHWVYKFIVTTQITTGSTRIPHHSFTITEKLNIWCNIHKLCIIMCGLYLRQLIWNKNWMKIKSRGESKKGISACLLTFTYTFFALTPRNKSCDL